MLAAKRKIILKCLKILVSDNNYNETEYVK